MSDFKSLQQLHKKLDSDTLAFLKYYEESMTEIDSLDDNDEEQRKFKLTMKGNYGLSLASNGYPQKAISVLEAFIPRFEKESGLTAQELLSTPYYEHLLWWYGYSLYNSDRVKESEVVFAKLVSMQPDNQKYKNWLKGTFSKRFEVVLRVLYIAILVWLVVKLIWAESFDPVPRFLFTCSGVLAVITTLSLEAYVYLMRRGIK